MAKTGSKDLDEFMGNYDGVTGVYGSPGTGKTTMMLLACVAASKKNEKVIFIDTENSFNVERFKQLAGESYEKLLENIFVIKIKSFRDQSLKVQSLENLVKLKKVSLIIIDSIGYYYRRLRNSKPVLGNSMLIKQFRILERLSNKTPVLLTNQVYSSMDEGVKPVGGKIIFYNSKCLVELEKDPRKIKMIKPREKEMLFEINNKGISKI